MSDTQTASRVALDKVLLEVATSGPHNSPAVVLIRAADAIEAAGWHPPAREVTNPADLDALPRGSAVLTRNGRVWQKAVTATPEWWPALGGWEKPATSEQLLGMGIVTVLHIPAEDWLRMVPATEAVSDGE